MWSAFLSFLIVPVFNAGTEEDLNIVGETLRHCQSLSSNARSSVRYLWVGCVPLDERRSFQQVLNFHVNSLSRTGLISLLIPVSEDVYCLFLHNYGWKTEVWEGLYEEENYFYLTKKIEKEKQFRRRDSGTLFTKKVVETEKGLHPQDTFDYKKLIEMTGSKVPMIRADWFLWQTSNQVDRKTGYYEFLGIKDEKTFDKAAGFSEELIKEYPRRARAVVLDSSVTLHSRRIDIEAGIGGPRAKTSDVILPQGKSNPLTFLGDDYEYDARESIGVLPNGLFVYGLFNQRGELQDSAPDSIASDSTSTTNDRRVSVMISCIRCHVPDAGFRPINGWLRSISNPIGIQSPDILRSVEIQQLYSVSLEPFLDEGRRRYEASIKLTTGGLNPAELANHYGIAYNRYDRGVSLKQAALECRVSEMSLVYKLKNLGSNTPFLSTPFAGYVLEEPKVIPRRIFDEHLGQLRILLMPLGEEASISKEGDKNESVQEPVSPYGRDN